MSCSHLFKVGWLNRGEGGEGRDVGELLRHYHVSRLSTRKKKVKGAIKAFAGKCWFFFFNHESKGCSRSETVCSRYLFGDDFFQ